MKQILYWTTFNIILMFYFNIQLCAEQPIWILGILLMFCYNMFFFKASFNLKKYFYYSYNYTTKMYLKFFM